jgi:DNA-binding NarL/FixJ family response regulator
MNGAAVSGTALIVDESPRWRALAAAALRDHGWTVTASAALPESVPPVPYDLLLLDPALLRLDDLGHLVGWAPRCVLLTSLSTAELPPEILADPRVLGVIEKNVFSEAALVALVQPIAATAAAAKPAATGPKVLVVEDDVNWRALYEEILGEAAFALYFAVSYGEARAWLQRVDFELAIVDLNLASSAAPQGNRDGFHLLRAARQRGVSAIVVSALGDPADVDRAYDEFGIFAFVEKEGFDRRNFRRLLDEARRASAEDALSAPPASEVAGGFDQLTPREREVLALLIKGSTNRQIAEALLITPNTTKKHVDHILQKLGASTRSGAVAAAYQAGIKPG